MEGKKLLIVTQHFWPEAFRVNDLAAGFIERSAACPTTPRGSGFPATATPAPGVKNTTG